MLPADGREASPELTRILPMFRLVPVRFFPAHGFESSAYIAGNMYDIRCLPFLEIKVGGSPERPHRHKVLE